MREIILTLPVAKKNSEKIILKKQEKTLNIKGFTSNLKNLYLVFEGENGLKKPIPIYEFGIDRTIENIDLFKTFWFEYGWSDMNYPIQIFIS